MNGHFADDPFLTLIEDEENVASTLQCLDKKILASRSIIFLNVSYKIIANDLSLKIHHLLPQIICLEQMGLIKSCYILDNIIVVWEGMEWARHSKQ